VRQTPTPKGMAASLSERPYMYQHGPTLWPATLTITTAYAHLVQL